MPSEKQSTRRPVFCASKIASLKGATSQHRPSKVEVVLALIVRRAIAVSRASRLLSGKPFGRSGMDSEAAKTARESLDLAFHMSNILETGLDRHTLSVLIALCDLGLNPEALAAVVKELRSQPPSPLPSAPRSSN
ncbi:hypothetical protein HS088_TW03G00637 [Tripterygium wilfordii]|uniref:Mitotic-spindle organizing protein 1B-like n=1 Tax=Tripterygium wilfordii TaxID=458696 RepID=A0A7J7DVH6_TRIWF|nr:hypothetical protein HS088_TW03G00637 [Tripterygium wilfordii]